MAFLISSNITSDILTLRFPSSSSYFTEHGINQLMFVFSFNVVGGDFKKTIQTVYKLRNKNRFHHDFFFYFIGNVNILTACVV